MGGIRIPGMGSNGALAQFIRWVFGIGYERNVGGVERTVRYTGGVLCIVLGLGVIAVPVLADVLANAVLAAVLLLGGLYLIYEARVQYCPLNHTLDRNTYPRS